MKADTHNDCLVNLPKAVYSVMATFLSNWRDDFSKGEEDKWIFTDQCSSCVLGTLCGKVFKKKYDRKFTFTLFRKLAQTIFDQTNFGPKMAEDRKWFNRMAGHRYDALVISMKYYFLFYFINLRPEVGDAFYTGTIARGNLAEMGRLMEEEMVVRERRWREVGFSVVSQETDNEGDGEPGREPNITNLPKGESSSDVDAVVRLYRLSEEEINSYSSKKTGQPRKKIPRKNNFLTSSSDEEKPRCLPKPLEPKKVMPKPDGRRMRRALSIIKE